MKKDKKINAARRGTACRAQNSKGITLVALILTIIILIILAGVGISIIIGQNGIFTKSKDGVIKYQDSVKREESELDKAFDTIESLDPDSLAAKVKVGDYVNYDPTTGVEEKDLKYTSKRGSYEAKKEDGTYIIGEGVDFANREDFSSYSNYNSDGFLYNKAYELIDINGNVTAGSGEQGSGSAENDSANQTFTAKSKDGLKWRVLSIEDGCVNLVSETPIKTYNNLNYYLFGITGYNYGIEELNNICSIYGHGKGAKTARSINVEDVNKITKYDPTKGSAKETYGNAYGWNENKWIYTNYSYNVGNQSNSSLSDGWNVDDTISREIVFGKNYNLSYWLASRCVYSDLKNVYLKIRHVDKGKVYHSNLFHCNSSEIERDNGYSYSVRPIVTLKSTVKAGKGTKDENEITTWDMDLSNVE